VWDGDHAGSISASGIWSRSRSRSSLLYLAAGNAFSRLGYLYAIKSSGDDKKNLPLPGVLPGLLIEPSGYL
jgi:hypothetical protein